MPFHESEDSLVVTFQETNADLVAFNNFVIGKSSMQKSGIRMLVIFFFTGVALLAGWAFLGSDQEILLYSGVFFHGLVTYSYYRRQRCGGAKRGENVE